MMQRDDPHETVPHSHAADVNAVEAEKITVNMRSTVRDNAAVRPGQVLARELVSASSDVRAAVGQPDVIRRKLRRQKRRYRVRVQNCLCQKLLCTMLFRGK